MKKRRGCSLLNSLAIKAPSPFTNLRIIVTKRNLKKH